MRALRFVLIVAVLGCLFLVMRSVAPWTILSVATWTLEGWLAMAAVACVIGLLTA